MRSTAVICRRRAMERAPVAGAQRFSDREAALSAGLRPCAPRRGAGDPADIDFGLYGMDPPDGLYKIGSHVQGDTVDPDAVRDPDDSDAAALSAQIAAHLPLHVPAPVRMKSCLYT